MVGRSLILPITVHDGEFFPKQAREYQYADFRQFLIAGKGFEATQLFVEFSQRVRVLCADVARLLHGVPPFDPSWPVVEPNQTSIPETALPKIPPPLS